MILGFLDSFPNVFTDLKTSGNHGPSNVCEFGNENYTTFRQGTIRKIIADNKGKVLNDQVLSQQSGLNGI